MEQRHGLVKNEIQSLAEYYDGGPNNDKNDDDEDDDDVDDHEADYEVDEQNQYHKSPSSTGIKKTISTENEDDGLSQPESNKKNHDDDINFEEDEEDEKVDIGGDNNGASSGNTLEMRSFQYIPRTYNHKQHHQVNQQPPNNNYPSVITRSEKGRKISSKRTNGLVDSRHISSEPVHSNPKDSSSSSYFNFMEYNKDNAQGEKAMRIKKKVVNSVEDEFRWRKDDQNGEMSDQAIPSRQQPEHDDETFATFQEKEMLDPSAVTNLAWKSSMVHPKKEISKRKDNQKNDHITFGNGHWDDPVKKDSSFAKSPGQVDQSVGGSKKRGSFNLPSSNSHQQLPQQQQLSSSDGKSGSTSVRHNICSPQDYEILKGELFQYDMGKLMNHMKLMTSVSNEVVADPNADEAGAGGVYVRYPREVMEGNRNAPWSDMMMASTSSPSVPSPWLNNVEGDGPEADKDNLLRHIFTLLDRNHDSVLEYVELYKAELENRLELRSPEKTGCQFRDFLLFDDTDHDGQLHVNEFFSSFSHFYDITMISLDKALETKYARVVEGDTVVLQCDITGSPPPYIRWKRYGADLSHMVGSGIKSNIDGTLALTNIHMTHAGHYSCQSPRNPEVVQTHILIVETQPYVLISPKASWKRPGEDLLLICRLVLPIMDSSSEEGSTNGRSISATKTDATPERGSVNWTWLFNGIPLRELPKSDSSNNSDNNNNHNNKYIFENSTSPDEGTGGGSGISRLRIREIYFQDSGSYTCQAELDLAGIGLASSSLVVIDPNSKPELQALHNINAKQLLVFHRNGLASYSAEHCGWLWEIFGDDVVQLSKEGDGMARAVCDQFHGVCDWGNAVQVSPNYVYTLQSSLNRVLLIDVGAVQSVGNAVGSIETCSNPTRIHYVPYTDQLWIKCEEVDKKGHRKQTSVFSVVEKASKGDQHHNLQHKAIQFPFQRRDAPASSGNHPGSSEGPERITEIYLPSHQDGKRGKKDCQFAFVWSVTDEQSLRRIDLKTFTYHKNGFLNLTKFSCIPHQIHFSLSCTISIINCLDPKTKSPNGQVVVDTLSNTVRFKTAEISGTSIVSPDNRILLTEKHVGNNTHVFVQRVGVYEINLLSHFLLGNIFHNIRVVHSTLTGAYASVAKSQMGKEAVLSLETGEIQIVDELQRVVPHSSRYTSLYPADNAFPLKTDKSVIVMDAETLRPRCKFYEEIPELQSFLTVQS